VRENILTNFNLPNLVDLTLNTYPNGAGKIHISTLEPEQYPWYGVYFNGVPVKIEAIADSGYHFKKWGTNGLIGDTLNPVFLDTLDASTVNFDAYFEQDTLTIGLNSVVNKAANFTLYPNPAKSTLVLRYNGTAPFTNLSLQVADLTGRIIQQQNMLNVSTTNNIDISQLAGGVYVLRLFNGAQFIQQFRFVKLAE
jgi:hypothetical protein